MVGIGAIRLNETDSASFDAMRAFLDKPIRVEGLDVRTVLADSVSDTDYILTGSVSASVTGTPAKGTGLLIASTMTASGGAILGGTFLAIGLGTGEGNLTTAGVATSACLLPAGGAFFYLARRKAKVSQSQFSRYLYSTLKLQQRGGTVARYIGSSPKYGEKFIVPFGRQPEEFRRALLAPLWQQVDLDVKEQIRKDQGGAP